MSIMRARLYEIHLGLAALLGVLELCFTLAILFLTRKHRLVH